MTQLLLTLSLLLAGSAYAEEKSHPCQEIRQACEGAGFHNKGHKEGKGLYKDCSMKIMNGEKVAGVNVSDATVSACKEKRAARRAKKQKS